MFFLDTTPKKPSSIHGQPLVAREETDYVVKGFLSVKGEWNVPLPGPSRHSARAQSHPSLGSVSKLNSVDPWLVSESHSVDPWLVSESHSVDPWSVSKSHSVDPWSVSELNSVDPWSVSELHSVDPWSVSELHSVDPRIERRLVSKYS